jgi:dUTP pyrophosphatase
VNDSGIHDSNGFDVVCDQPPRQESELVVKVEPSDELRRLLEEAKGGLQTTRNLIQEWRDDCKLRVKRLTPTAKLPTRGSAQAIGLDLYADVTEARGAIEIRPGYRALVSTGIVIALPPGYYGRVAPRSGLALKQGIDVMAGVIDEDYRGEIHALLLNTNQWETFWVKPGDRIAQLILERADIMPVVDVDELDATVRGANGYGSTGV